jgi:hypothetical protein
MMIPPCANALKIVSGRIVSRHYKPFRTGWKIMVARRGGTRANVSLSKSPAAAATTDPVTG